MQSLAPGVTRFRDGFRVPLPGSLPRDLCCSAITEQMDSSAEKITKLILCVHDLLHRYIRVHDEIFKFSLRKIIPIPGIFKRIEYLQHFEDLYFILEELDGVLDQAEASSDIPMFLAAMLSTYLHALRETILELREMCGRLYEKAQGSTTYSHEAYKQDLQHYEALVLRYKQAGADLNEAIRG